MPIQEANSTATTTNPAAPIERIVARAGELYSLPTVAMKVLELTERADVDARAMKQCIEQDPALTAKLLRVVNSSLFGLTRQVSDLNQAIALLGTKPLKLLVLGFSLPGGLFTGIRAEALGRYWRHSLTKAVAARELAERFWGLPGDEPFIAALLQDVGLLVLIQQLGEPFERFIDKAFARQQGLSPMERSALGFDHITVSVELLTRWSLPRGVVAAVGCRPEDVLASESTAVAAIDPMSQIVALAELAARITADGQPTWLAEVYALAEASPRFSRSAIDALLEGLQARVEQLAEVMRLPVCEGIDCHAVLTAAHAQLADVACQTAAELLARRVGGIGEIEESLLCEVRAAAEAMGRLTRSAPAKAALPSKPQQTQDPSLVANGAAQRRPKSPAAIGQPAAPADLASRLAEAVVACRNARCALSLVLLRWDVADQWIGRGMTPSAARALLKKLCDRIDHAGQTVFPYGDWGFAVILPNCERSEAVDSAHRVIAQLKELLPHTGDRKPALSLSAGIGTVSLPPRNFPPADLLDGAARCLGGAQASGGGVVKSIEVY